ncbi:MAG TPA: selenide, water dikinase SelD [Acidimicrobiales bacterium]|nr:selenide, water dikinase SelD [Acidimicrobiales bacterium]
MTDTAPPLRLTSLTSGGGCSCKIPAGELEELLGLAYAGAAPPGGDVIVGLESGDDATVVRTGADQAVVLTSDFFPPVVDDPFDWGRIAAANALSDVYAMGGVPVAAVNLLAWPREVLPREVVAEVIRGGLDVAARAGCVLAGGHSIDDPVPKYGLAVTGFAHPDRLLRNDAAVAGTPITLTKPIGVGILNNRHKATGERFDEATASMAELNDRAAAAAVAAGARAATDVTGFGLLGHLYKMCRASGVAARIDASAVPILVGARESLAAGFVPGGTRRNLEWVRPFLASRREEEDLLLLADAQTSGGLLVGAELDLGTVIGEFVPAGGPVLSIV